MENLMEKKTKKRDLNVGESVVPSKPIKRVQTMLKFGLGSIPPGSFKRGKASI